MTRTQPQVRADEKRWRRGDLLVWILAVLLGAVLALIVLWINALSGDLHTANVARDALARQVQHLGASPIGGPPGSRGSPTPSPGRSGPRGLQGPSGSPGASGEPAPTLTPSPGPRGASGVPGSPGPGGASGSPGVPGPGGAEGSPGVAGPAGPAGQDGKDGADGADGADGRDGSPPASWTWTDPAGVTYTCTRSGGTDDSPTYTCAPDSQPSPGNGSPSPSASQPALAPDRRRSS